MSLTHLLIGKKPPVLEEAEVIGAGASATSVVKATVLDPGGFSRLSRDQTIAVKKVYVPRHSVIFMERKRRHDRKEAPTDSEDAQLEQLRAALPIASDQDEDDINDDSIVCDSQDERRCAAIEREVSLLKSLNHPNIVSCFGVIPLQDRNMLGILMEYCAGNSLRHFYRQIQQQQSSSASSPSSVADSHQPPRDGLPEDVIRRFTAQMLCGLAYLHANGVVHRDLKGLNVLLSEDLHTCKLGDFGSATQIALSGSDAQFHSMQGTVWWMAPEQFLLGRSSSSSNARGSSASADTDEQQQGGSFVADVWSLGCTVLELALGAIPFTHVTGGQFGLMLLLTREIVDESELFPSSVVNSVPPAVMTFVRKCLVRDAAKRPTSAMLMNDPWIQGVLQVSPRLSRYPSSSTLMSRQPSSSIESVSPQLFTEDKGVARLQMVLPEGVAEKLFPAAEFWFQAFQSFDARTTISDLCRHLRAPSMSDVVASLFCFPRAITREHAPVSSSSSSVGCSGESVYTDFDSFMMFVSFFGPFDTLLADLWALEADHYPSAGYASYGSYAGYEATDSSHLLLSCLSKPYVKLPYTQNETEDALRSSPPGTFLIRYSSKCSEAPGSLTLSVRGEHGVLHHRVLRPPDAWSFLITLPVNAGKQRSSQRQPEMELLTGRTNTAKSSSQSNPTSSPLCFDTVEDLVNYFAAHGVPSQRSSRVYKLIR